MLHVLKNNGRRLLGERLYGHVARRVSGRREVGSYGERPIADPVASNEMIRRTISHATSAAIGKTGANSLRAVLEYTAIREGRRKRVRQSVVTDIYIGPGVFPPTEQTLLRYAERYIRVVGEMDLLATWFWRGERQLIERYCPRAALISVRGWEPFYVDQPWTAALEGRMVLVASPFVDSIEQQYARRDLIWPGREAMLPKFELQLMRLPLADSLVKSPFEDWFHAVDTLIADLRTRTFDVLLIGGGAFSPELVVAAKEMGKVGIDLGGPTQVLFGIRGTRWEEHPVISRFFNQHWIRPGENEKPINFRKVEAGCFW